MHRNMVDFVQDSEKFALGRIEYHIPLTSPLFEGGQVTLQCMAVIYSIYSWISQYIIVWFYIWFDPVSHLWNIKRTVVPSPSPEVHLKSHQLRNYVALLLQLAVFYLQESLPTRKRPHGSHSDPIYTTKVYDPLYQRLLVVQENYISLKSTVQVLS